MGKKQPRDPVTGKFLPKAKGAKFTPPKFPAASRILLEMQAQQKEMMKKMDMLEKKFGDAGIEGSSTNHASSISLEEMKNMENRLMVRVKDMSQQCDSKFGKLERFDKKFENNVMIVFSEFRKRIDGLQEQFEDKMRENNKVKDRLGDLEYSWFNDAIRVAEDLKAKGKVIAQLQEDLEKLKGKK